MMAVGFVPFTWNALSHDKVWHLLGDGGASEEMTATLSWTQQNNNEFKEKVNANFHMCFILFKTVT